MTAPINPISSNKTITIIENNPHHITIHTRTYGKKYDNLVLLQSFVKSLENVEVPFFVGLSTEEVEYWLKQKKSPFFDYWNQLEDLFHADSSIGFLARSDVKALLSKAQQEIITVITEQPWDSLWNLSPKLFWMVRSSGAEDGDVAGAGYNLSLAYVHSDQLGEAIGKVITSYLDPRLLGAQIHRGLNPFAKSTT